MKIYTFIRNYYGFLFLAAFVLAGACKKEHPAPPTPPQDSTGTSVKQLSDEDSLKFYVWWINESDSANVPFYLWYDQVPETNPFSSQFDKAEDLLDYMRSFPTVNGKKVDRYSFLDRQGVVSGELQGGVLGDLGFEVTAVYESQQGNEIGIYVQYVYPGSPAGKAGVERGWKIASVNGASTLNLTDQSDLSTIAKAIYSNPTATFTFQRPDGSKTSDIDLSRTTYHINPVLLDTVYTVDSKKVGYFVYNSFISVGSDENGTRAKQEIDAAFSKFKSAGVKELIVDLRYNGGGSVSSTEYLDNLIAPSAANGQEMYKYIYNTPLTNYFKSYSDLQDLLSPINFSLASNNLNLSRVFFIVGNGTASAAELTINNLKPYMDVKLIGDTTYGKPVGFFTIPIAFVTDTAGYAHVADMYAINFRSVNKNGEGDYYSGMVPDYSYRSFNVSNWGNTARDARLHAALNYIKTGSFERSAGVNREAYPQQQLRIMRSNKLTNPHQFNGMVDERRSGILQNLKKHE